MKRTALLALAFSCACASMLASGCAAERDDADVEQTESSLSSKLSPSELAATKQALRTIANANMKRTDNWPAVRAEIEPLVQKLARHFGAKPATAKIPLVAGAWRQLWSDYPYPMNAFTKMDPTQVYQVVDGSGHYWNIGDQKALGIFGTTGVLRGAFVPNGTKIDLEFTDVGWRFGRLDRGEDLVALANDLESGDAYFIGIPGGGKAPRGPVGITGTLETLYVDADLRVDRGTQNDFVAEDGTVVPGYGFKYFILDRVVVPAK